MTFDDAHAVADAGLILPATLAQHLRLRQLFDDRVDLGHARGRANVGLKAMTLIHSVLAGGDCIDDTGALRAGDTASVLGHAVRAPSTLGTFLRSFTWGHARQLDNVSAELLARAWAAGAGPGDAPVTLDVDSTICETYGLAKQGGAFGYTNTRGYHPLIAAVAGSGDVVHSRLRGGNAHTARGAASFLAETFNRVRATGATGALILRADSGFYSHNVIDACRHANVRFSVTAKQYKPLRATIAAIDDQAWTPIPYFLNDGADVAETIYRPFNNKQPDVRLIVRRVRPTPGSQLALFVEYSYHAFITDRPGNTIELEADHRRHAEIENVIRDLKYGVGLNHLPSGRFAANAAWLGLNIIAHNLSRWTARIGLGEQLVTHKTLRRRYYTLPGRLTHSARQPTLHLLQRWPWAEQFNTALANLRAVVLIT
ncbi:MAG: IS1380 family transposase [Actinomycetota bacterium]|nr:IS1380 family transposase [Actinomycetota bacterium]